VIDMQIRKMTINDYDKIYDLWINTPGMGLNDIDDSRDGIDRYLQRNPNTCFAAVEDGEIIGVIISGHDGRRGYIYHVSVKVSSRNRGVGTALLKAAMGALKAERINKVSLVVFSKNQIGNHFWEKQGFITRNDLVYRNKNINDLRRIDT
jgi:ribosomal protein S18 acetylase RimI-like enzyme